MTKSGYVDQTTLRRLDRQRSAVRDRHFSDEKHRGEMRGFGSNQMLACDPATGEVRRFLTGPVGCEIARLALTPDGPRMGARCSLTSSTLASP